VCPRVSQFCEHGIVVDPILAHVFPFAYCCLSVTVVTVSNCKQKWQTKIKKRPSGRSWRGPDDKVSSSEKNIFCGCDVVQPLEVFGGERHEAENPRHHKADVLKDGARRHAKEEKGRRL